MLRFCYDFVRFFNVGVPYKQHMLKFINVFESVGRPYVKSLLSVRAMLRIFGI